MTNIKKFSVIFVGLLVLSLIFTACGQQPTPAPASSDSSEEAAEADTGAAAETEAEAPSDSESLARQGFVLSARVFRPVLRGTAALWPD